MIGTTTTYPPGGLLLNLGQKKQQEGMQEYRASVQGLQQAAMNQAMQQSFMNQSAMNQQLNQWVPSTTSVTNMTWPLSEALGLAERVQALTAKKPDPEKDWLRKRVKEIMWKG